MSQTTGSGESSNKLKTSTTSRDNNENSSMTTWLGRNIQNKFNNS